MKRPRREVSRTLPDDESDFALHVRLGYLSGRSRINLPAETGEADRAVE